MSRLLNHFDTAKGGVPWFMGIDCLGLATEGLRLSGFDAHECRAIESELTLWRKKFSPKSRLDLIGLKATVDRCRRLAEAYLRHDEPYDCAGSFKVESLGIALFSSINSADPSALVGLPLIALVTFLTRCGLSPLTPHDQI